MSKKIIPDSDPTIGESMATSYGSVVDSVCLVCGREFNSSKILLANPVAQSPTARKLSICPPHQKAVDEGYIHMVSVDEGSPKYPSGQVDPMKVIRTGGHCEITREMFRKVFETDPPPHGVVFTNNKVIHKLQKLQLDLQTIGEKKDETV